MQHCLFIFCLLLQPIGQVVHEGTAVVSWYGKGHRTADGRRFNRYDSTICAHRTLPFGTRVRITNPDNGHRVTCVVHDRGPFIRGRQLDITYGAARRLGIIKEGVARVHTEVISVAN